MMTIDWTDGNCQVSSHFKVKDCLNLPTWGRLANEADGLNDDIKHNLVNTCAKMEGIRSFLGDKSINVHCMYRPPIYNKLIGGASHSAHLIGDGCDFNIIGLSDNAGCDSTRLSLLPKLEEFGIRMEDVSDKPQRNWVHIDLLPPIPHRYFKP